MRGLSLLQPWASLMAEGAKLVETRSWQTNYRGLVAIAASAKWHRDTKDFANEDARDILGDPSRLPLASIVCVGDLVRCVSTEIFRPSIGESRWGNYSEGRYAWVFENVRKLPRPVPIRGMLGLYRLEPQIIAIVEAQVS